MIKSLKEPNSERGMILVIVLWAVAIMTVMVVALSAYVQKSAVSAGVEADRVRTNAALEAGLGLGEALVLARRPEERVFFDGSPSSIGIGGGRQLKIAVTDAAGLVDINRADLELIKSLAASLRLSGSSAKTILDNIKELREAKLKKAAPGSEQPPPTPAFFSTAQLYGLEGGNAKDIALLLPFITLYSVDGKVNLMAAPEAVFAAIPGLTASDASRLMAARKRKFWATPEVQAILAKYEAFAAVGESKVFRIEVTIESGPGLITGAALQAFVIADDSGAPPFRTMALSW
jgi:general secretion pathway protein K